MKTSEKIVKARTAGNITQDQLAEQLGVSRQTVSKWELDVSLPDTSRLLKLAKLLASASIISWTMQRKTPRSSCPWWKARVVSNRIGRPCSRCWPATRMSST